MSEEAPEPPLMQADETLSPVDLPGADEGERPLAWTTTIIAVAALFLLVTNADTLDGWAKDLPPGPWAARVMAVTEGWAQATATIGVPRARLHEQWKRAEAARFDGPA